MRVSGCLAGVSLLCGVAFGQATESAPKFEVADIHPSARISQPIQQGPFYSSRYEIRFATMLDLIRIAYGVDPEKAQGGPSWLEMERFDIIAKPPAGSNPQSRRQMLQELLADRFHLVIHKDSKPISAFALTAGKHPQLKDAGGTSDAGCNFTVENPGAPPAGGSPQQTIRLPLIVYTCKSTSMEDFAAAMVAMAGAGQYFNNKLVVDQTGLTGSYDFTFKFTPKVPAALQVTGDNIPIFDALDKQLGLKLEAGTVRATVIVVDGVNKKPTPNSPDVAKVFPPLPTEFEVAEIKPSAPTGGRGGDNTRPELKNGRLYVPNMTLQNMISIAWDLTGNEMMVGAPKWLNDDRFDLIAKAPAGVALGDLTPQRAGVSVNIEALRPMLKALIIERFKLASHMEDRPINAYTLVAAKPKLKQADPAARAKWHEGPADDAKDTKNANAALVLGRMVTCQNVTMAQFADLLPSMALGYIHTPVVDASGLAGGWDFTFSFSPAGMLQLNGGRGGGDGGGGAAPEASEPNGAISLFDALSKQLGLKLEQQKRPTPVLVIDHVERKPVDN